MGPSALVSGITRLELLTPSPDPVHMGFTPLSRSLLRLGSTTSPYGCCTLDARMVGQGG